MSYELRFLDEALKEWRKLDNTIRQQFAAKLAKLLIDPKVPGSRLRGPRERYKIKLRKAGFRLVYEVRDTELIVLVIAVGKRENDAVYTAAAHRQRH